MCGLAQTHANRTRQTSSGDTFERVARRLNEASKLKYGSYCKDSSVGYFIGMEGVGFCLEKEASNWTYMGLWRPSNKKRALTPVTFGRIVCGIRSDPCSIGSGNKEYWYNELLKLQELRC
ncbi:hypothetical protein O181_000707 [Austropuccinia psidii MF-1]|uniref:Uncharacterized protein n=1 Tax=Austropuccinia psidii MF-1 TaxID=1389203 RepID=A0A9Q3GCB6_9BASI|nr:hypothetical protein [Austropuccinia psidii MF-1]